jgi:hypothetical protein
VVETKITYSGWDADNLQVVETQIASGGWDADSLQVVEPQKPTVVEMQIVYRWFKRR